MQLELTVSASMLTDKITMMMMANRNRGFGMGLHDRVGLS